MGSLDGLSAAKSSGRFIDLTEKDDDDGNGTISCYSVGTTNNTANSTASTGSPPPSGLEAYILQQRDLLSDEEKKRIIRDNMQRVYEEIWKAAYFRKLDEEREQKPSQVQERDITDLTKHPPGAKPFWVTRDGAVMLGIKDVSFSGGIPPIRSACIRSTEYDKPVPRPVRQTVGSRSERTNNAENDMDAMEVDPSISGAVKRRMTESPCGEEMDTPMDTPAKRCKSEE
ncbi:hypothetical protein F5Y18DRAFT_422461 [Xylariaceae sp. FL1019]|nr:hypothetical protein F5Y18DRAFT_422461 [Xylariaceae sp. FL1019]